MVYTKTLPEDALEHSKYHQKLMQKLKFKVCGFIYACKPEAWEEFFFIIKMDLLGLMLVLFKPCNGDLSSTCLIAVFMRIYTIYAS